MNVPDEVTCGGGRVCKQDNVIAQIFI